MVFAYAFFSLLMAVYSYVLIDLNLTLFNSPLWENFRSFVIRLGYYQRDLSALIYVAFILIFFVLHFYTVKKYKRINIGLLSLTIGIIFLFSYPFLSHDFFNYMFDAKILTVYHQNPYLKVALDFPDDTWLRFMQWVHRPYPYGPTFLPITLIPSFLAAGKLVFNFFLFKATWILFYLATVYCLEKMNKKWAVIFATHPLVIIEGLINSHNDFIALSLVLIGYYFLVKKKAIWGRIILLISGGIKYITAPFIFLSLKGKSKINLIIFGLLALTLVYLSFWQEIQPWYFLALLGFLPVYEELIDRLTIFFAGLLFSYYPYVAYGEWSRAANITLKHLIILTFFIGCLLYNVWHGRLAKKVFSSKRD